MRQNLAGALLYNTLTIPLAATGLVSPAIAAALMAASSLSVTLNTCRLVLRTTRPAEPRLHRRRAPNRCNVCELTSTMWLAHL